jgi:Mg-chelatase subunit ChlD
MKRILFDVSRWHLLLHREHRELPRVTDRDAPLARLEDEVFERLYAGEGEPVPAKERNAALGAWAERFHATCDALPAFGRLAADCRGDAAAAAEAVGVIMREVALPDVDQPPPAAAPGSSGDPLRRPLVAAALKAARAVQDLRELVEGLRDVAVAGDLPGTGTRAGEGREHAEARALAARLRSDQRLREIARLAGRFRRIAAAKRRSRVRHGADEIADVEQGGELERMLPSQLGRLRHPLLRLDFLRSFLERQALQYRLSGTETLGKGPLVVVLDKSGSMDGPRDVWATALSLALLQHAHAERRTFALLGFDGSVKYEATVVPGEALPEDGLFVSCAGGTDIGNALSRALELIQQRPGPLRKADVVLVTDGGSDTSAAAALRARAAELGVTVVGLGIGVEREWLTPWCDQVRTVTDLRTVDEATAAALFEE